MDLPPDQVEVKQLKTTIPLRNKVTFGMTYLPSLNPKMKIMPELKMSSDTAGGPSSLHLLVFDTDSIVVGRFEGVLRYAYTPFTANLVASQNTLYKFTVERYIKGSGDRNLKIYHNGGPLPWSAYGRTYEGFVSDENPIVSVGERYLLFLIKPDTLIPAHRHRGYVSVLIQGKREVTQYLDELDIADPLRGKILLRSGQALSADLSGRTENLHWRFETGPQLIDIPEHKAIANIKTVIASLDAMR